MAAYRCRKIKTGDRGQRYEVTFFNPNKGGRMAFGWSDDRARADVMCDSILKHPTWRDPKVRDRNGNGN